MELLDYYDENNAKKLGTKERDQVHSENLWHREIAVWIYNENYELLIQKRAANKKRCPNMYAVCAGHMDPGEEPIDAALREVSEEVGINFNKNDLIFLELYVNRDEENKHFKYMYMAKTNKKIDEMTIQYEELSELKYITFEELERIAETKDSSYTFSKKEYLKNVIEYIRKQKFSTETNKM